MKVLIDEDVIRKLASSTKIYMRGRNIFNAKQRIGPLFYDANKQLISAKVSSLSGNVYDTFMQLNNNGSLAGAGCSCAAFGIFKGPCKHVIALLFNLIDTELPDEGLTPEPLKVEDILYGTPNLNQPILSFDVLERIISLMKRRDVEVVVLVEILGRNQLVEPIHKHNLVQVQTKVYCKTTL